MLNVVNFRINFSLKINNNDTNESQAAVIFHTLETVPTKNNNYELQ